MRLATVRTCLTIACLLKVTVESNRHAKQRSPEHCAEFGALYPTIYDQLIPFLDGVAQAQVDLAAKHYGSAGQAPKLVDLKFDEEAAATLSPEDPAYPWLTLLTARAFALVSIRKNGTVADT